MIKLFFSFLAFITITNADILENDNSFITKFEYGKMLYNNPRGIGCLQCHGQNAEGKTIVSFEHVYRNKKYKCELTTPSIKNIDYKNFYKKVNGKDTNKKSFDNNEVCEKLIYKANVMPTYFLVDEEIQAIYYYINNLKD